MRAQSIRSFGRLLLSVVFATCLAGNAWAIQTTATIKGSVVNDSGQAVSGAVVNVTDTRSGTLRRVNTNSNGSFTTSSLKVGGPYEITVSATGYTRKRVEEVFLSLGEDYVITIDLSSRSEMEEIVVTGAALGAQAQSLGPSAVFSYADLQAAPAINRDIKDVIAIDPRIYIDEAFVDAIQCVGTNPRFNSLTVDSVRMNDAFGLNSNGYPTERMPFPFDSIEQVSAELAPFDARFGGFSACNINAVTRSGSNEFHGSVFYDYTSDSMIGDSLEGQPVNVGDFDEKRYGFSVSGPIIQDKLFFQVTYEKLEGANTFDRGVSGSARAQPVDGVSQADFDAIREAAINLYGYQPGGLPTSLPNEDEKFVARIDWYINDRHRVAFNYNYNDGFNISQADSDANELEFSNHYYERGAEMNAYVGRIFSDWTDNFSTEVSYSYQELDNRQLSLAGTDFGEVQIVTFNDPDGDGNSSRATVYLGADDSRHANKLNYENSIFRAAFAYNLGNHTISGGYELETYDVFNLFIQEAEGEYRFSSVQDFIDGRPNRITYENAAPSNVKENAAGQFEYQINTLYLQDEFVISSLDLTITAGVRYDWYVSDDSPTLNPNYQARYGEPNTANMDGRDLFMPRVGFNWNVTQDWEIHGGVGLFSGGNPNVWISNNYSNDGVTQVEVQDRSLDDAGNPDTLFTIPFTGDGRPIWNVPQSLFDAVASGTADSGVNSLDPNFKIPSAWKYSLGTSVYFDIRGLGDGYHFTADYLLSQAEDAAIIVDQTRVLAGTAPDGRPIYSGADFSDPNCNPNPLDPACSSRSQDFKLTNVQGDSGETQSLSFTLSKSHDFGLDWTIGYAYTETDEVNPMTSSVAFSNYTNIATANPNNPGLANSNYEIPHRITLRLAFERAFFGDNLTRITLFGSRNKGRPFSYTFDSGFMFGDSVGFEERSLLYIPTGPDSSIVDFGPGFDTQAFFNFVEENGLQPGIMNRNSVYSDWWTKFDLRVEQEFPGFAEGHKGSAFIIIANLGNLINDDWGIQREASFPRYQPVVDASIDATTGRYVYNEFFEPGGQSRSGRPSLWELRFGLRYTF